MSFEKQVKAWAAKAEGRADIVARTAAQDMAEAANTPREQDGRMPVDTGFLRNSIAAAISNMPTASSDPRADTHGKPDEVSLAINRWEPTKDILYIGWGAEYAGKMEALYGFRDAAVQNWPQYIRQAAQKAMKELP